MNTMTHSHNDHDETMVQQINLISKIHWTHLYSSQTPLSKQLQSYNSQNKKSRDSMFILNSLLEQKVTKI